MYPEGTPTMLLTGAPATWECAVAPIEPPPLGVQGDTPTNVDTTARVLLDYFKALNSIFTNHTKLFILYYKVTELNDKLSSKLTTKKTF